MSVSIETAKDQLRLLLPRYLEEVLGHPVEDGRNFLCPDPAHEDAVPSCTLYGNGTRGHCHGCASTFDIFRVYSWVNGTSLRGSSFITDNLLPLAKKYGITVESREMSKEERERGQLLKAHALAAKYLVEHSSYSEQGGKYLRARGFPNSKICRELGIGQVGDYNHYRSYMERGGSWTRQYLYEHDLLNPNIFNRDSITFTIKDARGRPVGFISRFMNHESTPKSSKYYSSSGKKNPLYRKGEILFGLDRYIALRKTKGDLPLIVVEGQFDWALLQLMGVHNVAAIGGCALTHHHLDLLRRFDITQVIVCLDSDKTGQESMVKYVVGEKGNPGLFSQAENLQVSMMTLPDGQDPATFVIEHSLEEFMQIKCVDQYDWVLSQDVAKVDPSALVDLFMPTLVAEKSFFRKELLLRKLAEKTGVSSEVLEKEAKRLAFRYDQQLNLQRVRVSSRLKEKLDGDPGSFSDEVRKAYSQLVSIDEKIHVDPHGLSETLAALRSHQQLDAQRFPLRLGKESWHLARAFESMTRGSLVSCAATINSGESALCAQLCIDLLEHTPDIRVLYFSTNEPRTKMIDRLVVQLMLAHATKEKDKRLSKLSLNTVNLPIYGDHSQFAYTVLRQRIRRGALNVKGPESQITPTFIRNAVRITREMFPSDEIIFIVDGVHGMLHSLHPLRNQVAREFGAIGILALGKGLISREADADELMLFRECDIHLRLLSDFMVDEFMTEVTDSDMYHESPVDREKLPIVDIRIVKNQLNGFRGTKSYKFWPGWSRHQCTAKPPRRTS